MVPGVRFLVSIVTLCLGVTESIQLRFRAVSPSLLASAAISNCQADAEVEAPTFVQVVLLIAFSMCTSPCLTKWPFATLRQQGAELSHTDVMVDEWLGLVRLKQLPAHMWFLVKSPPKLLLLHRPVNPLRQLECSRLIITFTIIPGILPLFLVTSEVGNSTAISTAIVCTRPSCEEFGP